MPSLRDRLAAALGSRYVVDRELATGGMGVVFLGHDPALGRELAIKVLPPERATAVAVERFVRESKLLARLAHPHIVPVLEAQQQGDLFWFVMPRVSGSTLAEHLASNGVMSEARVRRLGVELLDALSHSHQQGVIHRDIKPANIFLHADHALLADFGVAALLDSTTPEGLTRPGESVGTPAYMAPEQIAGGAATELSDQHAVAATLYEAISGRRWQAVANEGSTQWQGVPTSLVPALRRALERDPARRWPTAAGFAKALGARRMSRRMRLLIGGAVGVLLAATWWLSGTRLSGAIPSQGVADLAFEPFAGGSDSLGSDIPRATAFELERFPRIGLVPWDIRNRSGSANVPAATRIVSGRIVREGRGEVSLQVAVRDRDGKLVSTFAFKGENGDVVGWGAAIADSLVFYGFREHLDDFRMLAATRPSLQALRRYFRGQDLFQRDQWELAVAEFRAARDIDTTLVLATWHELIALKWQRLPFEERLAELASRADRLPVPMDALIRLQMRTDLRSRIAGLDSLVERYPHYAVVRQIRDNELFHRGPLIGRPLRDGLEQWAASAAEFALLDQADTYAHTVWGALRLGDESLARSQLGAHRRVATEDDRWGSLLALALDSRYAPLRARTRRWMLGQLADSTTVAAMRRAVRLGLQLDDPDDQRALGVIVASQGTNAERATGESAQATAELLQGHLAAASAALWRGRVLVPSDTGLLLQSAEWPVALPMFGVAVPPGDRNAARELLVALSTHSRWSARANCALAIDALFRGDSLALNERLGALRADAARDPVAASWLPFVGALQHAAAGRLPEALAASDAIYLDPTMATAIARGPFVRSAIYFNRGKWQLALGNRAGAEREWLWHENNDLRGWPAGEPQEGELDAALSAIVRLHRGENLLDQGKASEGCVLLRRVGELWATPDRGFADLHSRWQRSEARCRTR